MAPSGLVDVFPREIDLENVNRLEKFTITNVVKSFKELEIQITKREKCLKK